MIQQLYYWQELVHSVINTIMNIDILNRRQFLQASLTSLATTVLLPHYLKAAMVLPVERMLYIHNVHTGEHFKGIYRSGNAYNAEALVSLQHLLRDRRNDLQHAIDPALYDMLFALQQRFETTKPFELICGYRSPQSNRALHKKSSGVAVRSLHMQGKAVDIALQGIKLSKLRDAAKTLRAGGVGYYPASGFIHIDIRPKVAYW